MGQTNRTDPLVVLVLTSIRKTPGPLAAAQLCKAEPDCERKYSHGYANIHAIAIHNSSKVQTFLPARSLHKALHGGWASGPDETYEDRVHTVSYRPFA
jgi:hypothetical protein